MALLSWNPAWETGIEVIDEQHRELLGQMESLLVALHEHHSNEKIPGILSFLSNYVEEHFAMEEAHMQASQYPGLDAHKVIHDDMRAQVGQLLDANQNHPQALTEGVVDFLAEWLVNHINDEDRRMARHLHWFQARKSRADS